MSSPSLQYRVPGGGAHPRLGELEDVLFDEVLRMRSAKEKVSRQWIQSTALQIARSEREDTDFCASDKWLALFMGRYGLSLRRTTNLTVLTDDELTSRAVRFMAYLSTKKLKLNPGTTLLMDETALYFEDPRRDTVDITGARHVVLRSTGFASMRITVALTVTADGKKLPPLLIWKGAKGKKSKIEKRGSMYVAYQERAWMNSQLLEQWVDLMYPTVFDSTPGRGLVWDSMRAHISKAVKAKCMKKNVDMLVIPGGLTPYLQAGDIGIFKSFKDSLSSVINEWKTSDRVTYTRGGNPRAPDVDEVVSWVSSTWRGVPDDVVLRSVNAAGFNDDYEEWHISKHDVYGSLFQTKWVNREEEEPEEESADDDVAHLLDELIVD